MKMVIMESPDEGKCILCLRPLAARRWWNKPLDLLAPPPPFCRPRDVRECEQLLARRLRNIADED